MNLYAKLQQRAAEHRPVRIGLIGAGKFGSMYLAQSPRTPGVHLAGIADLAPEAARRNLQRVGWAAERYAAPTLDAALRDGRTHIGLILYFWHASWIMFGKIAHFFRNLFQL